jgi:hypothetical protein
VSAVAVGRRQPLKNHVAADRSPRFKSGRWPGEGDAPLRPSTEVNYYGVATRTATTPCHGDEPVVVDEHGHPAASLGNDVESRQLDNEPPIVAQCDDVTSIGRQVPQPTCVKQSGLSGCLAFQPLGDNPPERRPAEAAHLLRVTTRAQA